MIDNAAVVAIVTGIIAMYRHYRRYLYVLPSYVFHGLVLLYAIYSAANIGDPPTTLLTAIKPFIVIAVAGIIVLILRNIYGTGISTTGWVLTADASFLAIATVLDVASLAAGILHYPRHHRVLLAWASVVSVAAALVFSAWEAFRELQAMVEREMAEEEEAILDEQLSRMEDQSDPNTPREEMERSGDEIEGVEEEELGNQSPHAPIQRVLEEAQGAGEVERVTPEVQGIENESEMERSGAEMEGVGEEELGNQSPHAPIQRVLEEAQGAQVVERVTLEVQGIENESEMVRGEASSELRSVEVASLTVTSPATLIPSPPPPFSIYVRVRGYPPLIPLRRPVHAPQREEAMFRAALEEEIIDNVAMAAMEEAIIDNVAMAAMEEAVIDNVAMAAMEEAVIDNVAMAAPEEDDAAMAALEEAIMDEVTMGALERTIMVEVYKGALDESMAQMIADGRL